jgi:SAM-dependent methyltransferase
VAAAYDAARPPYPDGVFDALGTLDGRTVLDVGAGTGIASRQLAEGGAVVVSLDLSEPMLRHAGGRRVAADAATLPLRDDAVDLVTCAQAWHWVDHTRATAEVARVLRPGGTLALWWNQARSDGEPWFEAYWEVVERIPGLDRRQREVDPSPLVPWPMERVDVPWVRTVTAEEWLTDERSKSYVAHLPDGEREAQLAAVAAVLPGDVFDVRYETALFLTRP